MFYESDKDRIRHLENELYRARRTIFDLLPPDITELAGSYYDLKTRHDAQQWEISLAEVVIRLAWPFAQETAYSEPRADCPLCKRGTLGPYGEGFKLPEGLRKHLLGEGNAHQCSVMHEVFELAKQAWLPKAREAEAAEAAQKATVERARRASEKLYQTQPRGEPELLDEHLGWSNGPRDQESMKWAINRLEQLCFTFHEVNRVRRFTKDYGSVLVYADPRENGKITFRVFRKEEVENPTSRRRSSPHYDPFYLQDSWKNELKKKLDDRVQEAIHRLSGLSK